MLPPGNPGAVCECVLPDSHLGVSPGSQCQQRTTVLPYLHRLLHPPGPVALEHPEAHAPPSMANARRHLLPFRDQWDVEGSRPQQCACVAAPGTCHRIPLRPSIHGATLIWVKA